MFNVDNSEEFSQSCTLSASSDTDDSDADDNTGALAGLHFLGEKEDHNRGKTFIMSQLNYYTSYTDDPSLSLQESLDYYPFATKAEALMYIRNNGLRPVVSLLH